MKKISKILLAVLTLFTINLANIKADEIKVARINDTDYTSLDEAINAASDETTIELLNDAETAGMNLNKNIIIEGNNKTITFNDKGIALWGKKLTFKNTIITNWIEINNVYITGKGLIINNIDLLFQESFMDKKCEILVPYFVEKTNVKINIKDYLEVNSAIALAMNGLEAKKQNNNFSNKGNNLEKLRELLTTNVNFGKKIAKTKEKKSIKEIMHGEIDTGDKILLRTATMLTLVVVIYIAITETLSGDLLNKISTAEKTIEDTNAKIAKVNEYDTLITTRTNEYQKLIDAIDQANSEISENYSSKNAIPNLLTKVMFNIPKGVQLLSVENTSGKNITITAQARKYDQLGYFKAALDELGILTNITTTKGVKQGELISVTITGELPY